MPDLEITEVVLIHCIIVNKDYQQDSRVLYTFFPNKSFGQLLDITRCQLIDEHDKEIPKYIYIYIYIYIQKKDKKLLII